MLNALGLSQAPATSVPAGSQSVLTMTQRRNTSNIISTLSAPLDRLLSGGLRFGTALELSGPPGTPKEALASNICRSFVRSGKNVLFVGSLRNAVSSNFIDDIRSSEHAESETYC